jgi:hypothetical protein
MTTLVMLLKDPVAASTAVAEDSSRCEASRLLAHPGWHLRRRTREQEAARERDHDGLGLPECDHVPSAMGIVAASSRAHARLCQPEVRTELLDQHSRRLHAILGANPHSAAGRSMCSTV